MKTIYVGIDPGQKGAIALIINDNDARVIDMPLLPSKEIDGKAIFDIFVQFGSMYKAGFSAILEQAQSMPKQGVVSIFTYGEGYGRLKQILELQKIPYALVRPQKWKKFFSLNQDKKTAVSTAMRLFPDVEYYGTKGGIKDGRAEALLMAQYGKSGGK